MQQGTETQPIVRFTLPVPTVDRYLVVTCGALHLAVPETLIREILPRDEAVALSAGKAPAETHGVTDLAARLEYPTSEETPETEIILVGRSEAHAYRVEKIQGFVEVRSYQRRPLPSHFMAEERRWFAGLFLFRETVALILNPHWLLGEETAWEGDPWPAAAGTEVLELEVACNGDDAPWADF